MKNSRVILSIAVGLFSLVSGLAGEWTFNPQTGRLRHDESGCTKLERMVLPDAVTQIGSGLFNACTNLRSVSLPPYLDRIEGSAFDGCSALGEIDIPDGPEFIDSCTFRDCTSLRRIRLPDTLTQLDPNAFLNCPSLRTISLPKNLQRASFQLLRQCPGLDSFSVAEANPDFKAIDGVLFSKGQNFGVLIFFHGKKRSADRWTPCVFCSDP